MSTEQAYRIFTDMWRLFRKYAGLPGRNDQDGWAALKNDIDRLDEQYHGNYMARKLMLALVDILEHAEREEKHEGKRTG